MALEMSYHMANTALQVEEPRFGYVSHTYAQSLLFWQILELEV